jgi:hypothetical protein
VTTISCTAAELPALFRRLETERLERVQSQLFEAAQAGVPIVARAAPVDTGELRRSVHAVRVSEAESRLVVDSPVAGIVEVGSRPHWAPLGPILAWVRRHRMAFGLKRPRIIRMGHFQRALRGVGFAVTTPDLEAIRVARAIQASIAKNGTRPRWFVRSSLPKLRKILDAQVKKAIRDP